MGNRFLPLEQENGLRALKAAIHQRVTATTALVVGIAGVAQARRHEPVPDAGDLRSRGAPPT